MNERALKYIFENGSNYYLVEKSTYEARGSGMSKTSDGCWWVWIDCSNLDLDDYDDFDDLTLRKIKEIESLTLDKNIPLDSKSPPFQIGFTCYSVKNIISINSIIKDVAQDLGLKLEDIVIPFFGGIGLDYKSLIIKLLEEDEDWHGYRKIITQYIKEYLKEHN